MNASILHRERKWMSVVTLTFGVALFIGVPVCAEEPNEGAPGDWLSRYAGPRSVGLGSAFVAVADEPTGVLWNPAGLSWLDRNEVQVGTVQLFEDTSINSLSFAVPAQRLPSIGLTVISLRSGKFQQTSELNEPLGEFNAGDIAFLLTAAKSLSSRWSVGANLKVVRQSIEDFNASGVGVDLGVMGQLTDGLRLGVSVLNLGGPSLTLREVDESYPEEFRGGLSLRLLGGNGLISAEVAHRDGPGTNLRAGAEIWILSSLALRLGYYIEDIAGGFSYRFTNGLQFDYGLSDHELGMTHRIGLSYRFGGFYASSHATPEVFSPTGQQPITKFLLTTRTKDDAQDWRLRIVNKSDEVVRSFGGPGVPPAHVVWDGKSETGLRLPDGQYRYRLVVRDSAGREMESNEQVVEINTGGPQGSVPVIVQ
jgi:hypothetical protein